MSVSESHRLSNADLVARLKGNDSTPSDEKEYLRRLDRLKVGHTCEGGHPDCAIVADGPCSGDMATIGY